MAQVETEFKERPILFSGAMVKAILEGRKTQTRRVVKPAAPFVSTDSGLDVQWALGDLRCPYGEAGERLWVRETFNTDWSDHQILYKADGGSAIEAGYNREPIWKPSIHMPRWASRITLEIKSVRVERIQDISEADAIAEGIRAERDTILPERTVYPLYGEWEPLKQVTADPKWAYRTLWDSINAKRGYGWEKNSWCWAIEFDRA